MRQNPERLDRGIFMSVLLHTVLGAMVVVLPAVFPAYGIADWGSADGGGAGVSVEIVSTISGIPLPAPARVSDSAAANESAGFYETETAATPEVAVVPDPTEPPPPEAEPVPETVAAVETPPPPPAPSPPTRDPGPPSDPDNAVPFGQGGRPAINYGQFSAGDGTGGIAVGDGAFGERYGRYVESITRRISDNWIQSLIASDVRSAPRIYVNFEILRDGTIVNERIEQGSGIASLDRSALRAIFASNPLAPLPADFRGRSVSVRFWFEYKR